MNCRAVETNVFTDPAVAGILSKGYIESRLHVETFSDRGGADWDAFLALRDKHAESPAMPTYAIVRPDDDVRIGWHQLQGGPGSWKDELQGFLERALANSRP